MIPNIKWAQTKNCINFVIDLQNIDTFSIDCIDDKFTCSYILENDTNENEFELELLNEIESFNYTYGKFINIILEKKEEIWWKRLTKEDIYKNKIKIDWDKWKDEDDSENENEDENLDGMPPGMDMEQMMEMMKNMQPKEEKKETGMPKVCTPCPNDCTSCP